MAFSPNRSFTTKFYNTWLICHSKSWGTAPSFLFESTFVGFGYNSHDHGLLPISEPTLPGILVAMRAILNIVYHETFHNKHMWKEKEKRKIIKSWSDSVKEMGKPKSMSKKAKKLAKKKGT